MVNRFLKLMKLDGELYLSDGCRCNGDEWNVAWYVRGAPFSRTENIFSVMTFLLKKRFPELSPCFVDTTSSENLLRFNLFRYSRTKGIF